MLVDWFSFDSHEAGVVVFDQHFVSFLFALNVSEGVALGRISVVLLLLLSFVV